LVRSELNTLSNFTVSFAILVLTFYVAPTLVGQDDLPPRPRFQATLASSVPVFQPENLKQEKTESVSDNAVSKTDPTAQPDPESSNTPKQFDISFEDLKFEMEKGGDFDRTMLTDKINSYHGATVSIRGFIRPSYSQTGLTKFVFVRDNKECCFGPGAALYDCVLVRLKKGLKTDYTVRPVTIEGKFALKEYKVDGTVWSIYRMTDTKVK